MKIGDLIEEFKELPGRGPELPVLTLTEKNGFMLQSERFNKRLATENTSKYKVVHWGDIAFNPYLLWAGALAQNTICEAGIISPLYPTFRTRDGHDARFVGRFLLTPPIVAQYDSIAFGSVPRRRRSAVADFLDLDIPPVPPLEEQRRIASILDAADALRSKRRQALEKLDTLTQSIFIEMFGDAGEWEVQKLGTCVETTSGGTPSRSRAEYFRGTIPWVKSGELAAGLVVQTQERITAAAVANSSAKVMPPGTVLLAMYGATVGEAAILGVEAATNQAVCCLSPNDRVLGPYLLGFLQAVKHELVARAAGGAQPNISQTIVRDLDLPLPPIRAQTDYTERVKDVEKLRSGCSSSLSRLDALFTSLQHRAFRGEL